MKWLLLPILTAVLCYLIIKGYEIYEDYRFTKEYYKSLEKLPDDLKKRIM